MNELPTPTGAKVLAYVHGQLSDEDKAAVEAGLFKDGHAAQALRTLQGVHDLLSANLAEEALQEDLVDRLLEAFDSEQNTAGAVPAHADGAASAWWTRTSRWIPLAAAVMLLFVGVRLLMPSSTSSVTWKSPLFEVPEYRGAHDGDLNGLNAWYLQFKAAVDQAYQAASSKETALNWQLEVSINELPQGEYRVLVQAVSGETSGMTRQWQLFVVDLHDLVDSTSSWADQIGQDLATPITGL